MFFQNTLLTIDIRTAPIVIFTFAECDPTEAEFEAYLNAYKKLCEETSPFVLVFDATQTKNLRADLRVRQSKWIEQNRSLLQEKIAEAIFIISSTFIRIVINGIFLLSKPPYPYSIVASMEEAQKIAKERLGKAST